MRTQDLQKIGLSDKESVIYLTSLSNQKRARAHITEPIGERRRV